MTCYICEKTLDPNKWYEYGNKSFCCRGCVITFDKRHNDNYIIRGGDNEYISEVLWGYPKENLLDKIDIYKSIYPSCDFNTTISKIYEQGIEYKVDVKRLINKKQ
jgi:hypothetical protein